MKKNNHVYYKGKEYVIFYKYSSGYCEIKEIGSTHHIQLVHFSELTIIN